MVRATGAAAACGARGFPFVDHTTHVAIRVCAMETALAPDVGARSGKFEMDRKVYECSRSSEPFSSGSGLGCRSAPYTPAKHVLPKVTCSDE